MLRQLKSAKVQTQKPPHGDATGQAPNVGPASDVDTS